jgi:hypothetical protein
LHELKRETQNPATINNRVCPDCSDPDQPQYRVSKLWFWDEISVPDAASGLKTASIRASTGAICVGNMTGVPSGVLGDRGRLVSTVTVVIS